LEKRLAKKRRLSKAEKQKRENFKWILMFTIVVLTIAVYLASFVEVDKTQSSIDFNKKTLVKLDEKLKIRKNAVERLKRADIISKKGKKIGLVPSKPETITLKVND
tara:strand:- start:131 stop:448 length:318 start_codon:yes stop_codon:yes gene_type:complete